MKNIFAVGNKWHEREEHIYEIAKDDPSVALILAAVTFEMMLKRFILKLSKNKTAPLQKN